MLLDEEGKIQLWRGPKENRHRPSINASFRSAAVNYRDRVIGVILSGMLDDGATGLWWIKQYGGLAVVQDPIETQFPDMPCAALEHVDVDRWQARADIGALLTVKSGRGVSTTDRTDDKRLIEATCPDCRGPMTECVTTAYTNIAVSSGIGIRLARFWRRIRKPRRRPSGPP